jgi:MFS family permease
MMVELTGSSFLAALVQTAVFLPMFLLALPAGVLADITDRRRLILGALACRPRLCTLLAVLVLAGGPGRARCCSDLRGRLLHGAAVAGLELDRSTSVPREELPQAITAVGIAYNAARALGPALAGWVFATAGGGWNFALAVLSTLVMMEAVRRWPPAPAPAEPPAGRAAVGRHAQRAALRLALATSVLAQLVRTGPTAPPARRCGRCCR